LLETKLDKFNEVNDRQLLNIFDISITSEVSKVDKFNEVNDRQLLNIFDISITFEVSKFDTLMKLKIYNY
jgi:hypothetical protein